MDHLVSLRPFSFPLAPFGQPGTILIDLDRSHNLMLDEFQFSASGEWSRSYPLPPATASRFPHLLLHFQAFSLEPAGGLRASCCRPGAPAMISHDS